MSYKTWMEKQLSLYAVWDHFVRDINLHVSLIHIGNLLDDFNHTYMLHLNSHPDDPSILEAVGLTAHDNNMPFPQCGVDENMIGTMIFEDSQVMIGSEVESLVCHGVSLLLACLSASLNKAVVV